MKRISAMLRDDSGAVTVDFVVLTAGVVAVAMIIVPILVDPLSNIAAEIGNKISEARAYMQ